MDSALNISIDPSTSSITMRAPALDRSACWSELKDFLARILASRDVASVDVDRWLGAVEIKISPPDDGMESHLNWQKVMHKLAKELRRRSSPKAKICNAYQGSSRIRLAKFAKNIVGGRVCTMAAGRTRLQHPLLKDSPGLNAIVRPLLASQPDVENVIISSTTGTVLIIHATTVSTSQLIVALELAIDRAGEVIVGQGSATQLTLGAGCLGLAAVAELMIPGLIPVAAGVLVANNLPTLGRGARELVTMRWRLSALYTAIMGATLVSGHVLAAALMQISIVGWYAWSNRRVRTMVDELLSSAALNHLPDTSSVPQGVLANTSVGPMASIEHRTTKDEFATTSKSVKPDTTAQTTLRWHPVCDSLIASLAKLASDRHPTPRGHHRASQFVPLTFATGAAAALTSDLATLTAVLRPDFATGPSIAERLSLVTGMRSLMDRGWLVLRPDAIAQLSDVETFVVLDDGSQSRNAAESETTPKPAFTASRHSWKLRTSTSTVDVHRVSGAADACAAYVTRLLETGKQVAVIGSVGMLAHFSPEAVVRITDDVNCFEQSSVADIVALPGRCEVPELWETLVSETRGTNNAWSIVMTCNLASVAGAFLAGLTSLHVIVLTNLGTWAAYSYFADRPGRRRINVPETHPTRRHMSATNGHSTATGIDANSQLASNRSGAENLSDAKTQDECESNESETRWKALQN